MQILGFSEPIPSDSSKSDPSIGIQWSIEESGVCAEDSAEPFAMTARCGVRVSRQRGEGAMGTDAMGDDGLDIGIDTMLRDEPGYRVRLLIEAADDPGQLEMRLEMSDQMTWWKSMS
jgi:hypothetical protein